MRAVIFVVGMFVLVTSHLAGAQTFYEPVRYQYTVGTTYFYGGSSPDVFNAAQSVGRRNGFVFTSANVTTHQEVSNEPVRVFSDTLPGQNAHLFGFTPDDARNEANASVPTYFRKADLLAGAVVQPDGSRVVPAREPVFHVAPTQSTPALNQSAAPVEPKPLMIIPKSSATPQQIAVAK